MTKTCKTCRHWLLLPETMVHNGPIFPMNPKTYRFPENEGEVVKEYGYRVRACKHPRILFYHRPDRDAAAVYDGSDYTAQLYTGEDFGCVLHEGEAKP